MSEHPVRILDAQTAAQSDDPPSRPSRPLLGDELSEPAPKTLTTLREYWDADAATYDDWPDHGAWSAGERAAWVAALSRFMPKQGARILDVGAGTGFLSLMAASLGHEVTALDISEHMLERLRAKAVRQGVHVTTVCAPADEPPQGEFDYVLERLVLWTLPDPARTLAAWREVAPRGHLLAFEGLWRGRDYLEGARRRARRAHERLRRRQPAHHAPYPGILRKTLPLIRDASPSAQIEAISAGGWHSAALIRLSDVEWARKLAMPPFERLLGVTPEYLITAEADAPA